MKIGIITFTEGSNYGNKLQNFALKEFLSTKYNADVVTIRNKLNNNSSYNMLKMKIKWLIPSKKHIKFWKRDFSFSKFNKIYLNFSKKKLTNRVKNIGKYDYLVCGSDQIWNPFYYEKIDLLCGNINGQIPAISYAASFGVNEIPQKQKEDFKNAIKYLKGISVREEQGKIICKDIGIRDEVEVNLDPTMLLSKDRWISLLKRPRKFIEKKYVLTYFIGSMSDIVNNTILDYCKNNNCELINLNSKNDLKYYDLDPFEFLFLINNADIIFTDSFHASVFSIIFDKKFIVCDRIIKKEEEMNSRIDTLLTMFDLKYNRFYNYGDNFENLIVDSKIKESILIEGKNKSERYFNKFFK